MKMTITNYQTVIGLCLCFVLIRPAGFAAQSNPAAPADKPATTDLSAVKVKGIKELVHALQTVKVALKRHYNNDPKRVDEMICELHHGPSGGILECGTQGWYEMRREVTRLSLECRCDSASPKLGNPWHSVRYLNHTQLMHLRNLLKKLPATDSNQKILVEWNQRQVADQNKHDRDPGRK